MNQLSSTMIIFVFLSISSFIVTAAAPTSDESAMRDLYDFVREYDEPSMEIDSHEVERKSIRSPSRTVLRLRFGRGDPVASYRRDFGIKGKPRSPSMRMRFGRGDPFMPEFMNENHMFGDASLMGRKVQRAPIVRFRFGKRGSGVDSIGGEVNALRNHEEVEHENIFDGSQNN